MTRPSVAPSSLKNRWNSLRVQFMGVVFALTFFPNVALVLLISQGQVNSSLVAWVVMVGAMCALLGYYLSGLMLRPLLRLRTEVEDGDFHGASSDDPQEVRALRVAFTELLARLNTEQMRRHAFMATLVHDLKTPLIAIGHLTRLLVGESVNQSERQEIGEQMLSENTRLLGLVQQMADAHRFEREDVQLSLQHIQVRPILERLEQRLSARAEQKGIQVQVLGVADMVGDSAILERALGNLAENALRYACKNLYLLVCWHEGHWWLGVADDGPGLSRPLSELAQPFNAQPVEIGGQQYTAGTAGLGLFIARRIAEAHGGQLQALSGPLGEVFPELLPQLLPEFLPARTDLLLAGLDGQVALPTEQAFTVIALQLPAQFLPAI